VTTPLQSVPKTLLPAPVDPINQPGPDSPDFASVRFRLELNQLESVLERIDGARIEMAVSQAAFKYRYTIVRPAEVPRRPSRPNLQAIIAAGAFGSLLLAVVAAVTRDLLSNRILEAWQIERQLGLPILGVLGNV
jgi:capsular polysaccharide biosynthesis protein